MQTNGGQELRSDLLAPWTFATAIALLALAGWLRDPRVEYLAAASFATLASIALVPRALGTRARGWRAVASGLTLVACVGSGVEQRELSRVRSDWTAYDASQRGAAASRMQTELTQVAAELQSAAQRALVAAGDRGAVFALLGGLSGGAGERGIVLYECDEPLAWGGMVRVATDTLTSPLGVATTPTYVVVYAVAKGGTRRAVATALIHAEPPGSSLSHPLDVVVARATGALGFTAARDSGAPETTRGASTGRDTAAPATSAASLTLTDGGPPLVLAPRAASPAATVARLLERARLRGALLLALALAAFVGAVWRSRRGLAARFGALVVPLLAVGLVPLNALSNVTRLFDPALDYASLGGPWTASAGALGLTGAILLLGLLALLRSPFTRRSRVAAAGVVIVIAGAAPFLLRELARGMQPPPDGVPAALWMSWETALFLAGCVLLLAGASAGRAALGRRRGLPPSVAPLIAIGAALTGPMFWEVPGRWPGWYTVLWVAAIVALAFTRRTTRFVAAAAIIA